ncbi:MAG: 50S ribosomal protein L29 [Candidatus Jacksonbacteria bacterium RIFOXYA2_FULL_44_7]|uniref:Large ribosomal subunit protein uL29 n=1 Tax=Candidatus Jacksonbacteria bacterium RIFCSPLOWO2_02_FULL_44_20 TaxID=1798460 RepID=A0A1G2A9X8_9BACT|nr:MAG: 50S ribosomal protein L29 [Parcubacteria group bacterium GW2011_GWC2_44_17]KKT49944.1 MAG: 50S ribosomal protein L29 [Parcubacteria group bacterium GW2011_GWF2_44_17]OGY70449.1 MAG: 50S ribosomal protein L29 [Candidatus Jacksonbacteria bacterium RIFCSPHIGHO2_12_FULL_44_12]OGY71547.1 MAG: 50S ribosomal protein L29 [Candidatus Jacksonbacteria bacterium RIFCSPHIGHO2_02_FULL_44_25]OGY73664.1 MAG: 50S ribosomal protein L29 [Candidatus Jacksonbacteria bacterium RIFCSPLOWO2_02_FULL_44_20]OGY7
MKPQELRQLDTAALIRLLNEEREKLRELRFKTGQGQLKNVKEIKAVRTLIAQIKTITHKI